MGRSKSKGKRSGSKRRSGVYPRKEGGGRREWVGGVLPGPAYILDREEPYRPDLVIWMELPDRMVVGHDLVVPEERPGALGRVLREAMRKPLVGSPRRPPAIRISDHSLVEEVRAVAGGTVPVRVAPTPELDEFLRLMQAGTARDRGEDPGWLDEGRIRPEVVEDLFEAARLLYRISPWETASDDQVLRMDIPELGVDGACLSIIGNAGISTGVLIFPSLDGFLAFAESSEEQMKARATVDIGTSWISLSFEPEEDLPPVMRREMAEHGWPVAGPGACPEVRCVDPDLTVRPLTEKNLRIVAACARSLTAFFVKHRSLFKQEEIEPVCESYFDEDDLEVRFTAPYEARDLFDLEDLTEVGAVGLPDETEPESDRHPLHDLDRRFSKPPVLTNTDGDPLNLTTDIFEVAPGRRKSLEARLAGWPDVDVSDDGEDTLSYAFLKERRSKRFTPENVLVGRGFFEEGRLHLETNSLKRADALRERLESAFGGHLEHRERVHLDLSSAVAGAGARSPGRPPEFTTPELAALTRDLKQQHYADWIDQPLPALKGQTPREAVRTAAGREDVEILIKEMENMEARLPESARFDFSELRRKLGSTRAGRPKGGRKD
jgi:hypothetical protein